jgi:integrase
MTFDTSVSLAIAVGAHPKAIQERLGHSSITTTLDRYGHLFPGIDEELGEKLGKLRARGLREAKGSVVGLR